MLTGSEFFLFESIIEKASFISICNKFVTKIQNTNKTNTFLLYFYKKIHYVRKN